MRICGRGACDVLRVFCVVPGCGFAPCAQTGFAPHKANTEMTASAGRMLMERIRFDFDRLAGAFPHRCLADSLFLCIGGPFGSGWADSAVERWFRACNERIVPISPDDRTNKMTSVFRLLPICGNGSCDADQNSDGPSGIGGQKISTLGSLFFISRTERLKPRLRGPLLRIRLISVLHCSMKPSGALLCVKKPD